MDPYQPPSAATTTSGVGSAQHRKHSVAGIISTVIGVACAIGLGGAFTFITMQSSDFDHREAIEEMETLRSLVRVAVAMVVIGFLALIGAACAIAGLGNRQRRRLFPILGLALNSLVVLAFAACMVIGWAISSSQP